MQSNLSTAAPADRISLPRLASEQGVSPVTVWRWALRGVAGVKLATVCVGCKRFTTREAFTDWCEAVTAARNGERVPSRTNRQREAAIERAEKQLAEMGV